MNATTCPRCGATGSGNFCSHCGASLGRAACPGCGHVPESGARFCTQCGTGLGPASAAAGSPAAASAPSPPSTAPGAARPAGAGGSESRVAWGVAGVALVAVILLMVVPRLGGSADAAAGAGGQAAPAGSPPSLDAMTPQEAADRLYVRVKNAAERGDRSEMTMFLPMAVAAHERALPLDEDRMFHLAQLQIWAEDAEGARATSETLLETSPDFLLALGTAAEAAEDAGDDEAAAGYWRRFQDAYDAEMATSNETYAGHGDVLTRFRSRARRVTGDGS